MGEIIVPPRAEIARTAIGVDGDHVGHLVDQPPRRRRRGRAHDDLEAVAPKRIHRGDEPAEIELNGAGLKPRPGEFANPHIADADFGHAAASRSQTS
jgi:hypothetical protein